ncbi:MAG TPA: cation-transporting P-type ATPase, partial [Chitinophagaceae bacterium]|nr:cation-transporting P-type ATPase [Chitinophagaceae bacterium]
MSGKVIHIENLTGLSNPEVIQLREQYGKNLFQAAPSRRLLNNILAILKEPMMILLIISCSLYFTLGETSEGILMLVAISIVSVISLYQESRSNQAIEALNKYSEPRIKVIREGLEVDLASEDLVPGDIMLL